MPSSRYLISSQVLTGTASSVTFSSIPSSYTDLVLKISARTDIAATNSTLQVYLNSTSGTTAYSNTRLFGNSSTAGSGRNSSYDSLYQVNADGSTATASTFSSVEIYIPSYTVAQNKPAGIFGATENNASTAGSALLTASASLWQNTAAVSSIVIDSTSNFVAGSSFYLYGLKNS